MTAAPQARTEVFDYAFIRVVPRVERGEAINVGVIVYSHAYRCPCARIELDEARLLALDPRAHLAAVRGGLRAFSKACTGDRGPAGRWVSGSAGSPCRAARWSSRVRCTAGLPQIRDRTHSLVLYSGAAVNGPGRRRPGTGPENE